MSNSDSSPKNEKTNIINVVEEFRQHKDEINRQINGIYTSLPKLFNQILEYMQKKDEITEEKQFVTFSEKLRNINQKITEFFSDIKITFSQIVDKNDNPNIIDDYTQKYFEEKKTFYDNFYKSFDDTKKVKFNIKEEYIKSFLNSTKLIFEEFYFLLSLNNENILPYCQIFGTDSESHIQFFSKINNLFCSFNNKGKFMNNFNDISQSILEQSKIMDVESMSLGSSLSEFRVNLVESVEQFNKEDSNSIDFIKFNAKNLNDLSFMKNSKLFHLKRLELRVNNIIDISPLIECSCFSLLNLNISHNQLNNDCIEILLKAKFDNLQKLILFDNKITTVQIFKLGEKFPNLKKFHIGKNLLNPKELIENVNKFQLVQSIQNIGMSNNFNNCFSNQNNIHFKFFNYISLENIKILYLNRNDLYSLKCFEKNNFDKLEMVWLTYNHISDIEEIKYFHNEKNKKTLTAFLLNGNDISSISDNFIKLLDLFELNILNISLNPIKLEDYKDKVDAIEKKGIRLLSL